MVNRCLKRIITFDWSEFIPNLCYAAKEEPIGLQPKKRKRYGIGQAVRKDQDALEKRALSWNLQRQGKGGKPRKTWRSGEGN